MNRDSPRTVWSLGEKLGDGVHVSASFHDRRNQIR
jgi:hypothetical protein